MKNHIVIYVKCHKEDSKLSLSLEINSAGRSVLHRKLQLFLKGGQQKLREFRINSISQYSSPWLLESLF